ncbi:hypothetical protein B0H14DRAFT_2922870 [Mycena olivaceomarginata]|nr:hypothetical protein B0H14DRAFT_2922870 [Mycena olivaceomarginata]
MVLHRRRTLAPCCSSAATATKSQAAEEGDCVGVAGMGLSDPDRAPSSSDPLLLSSELEASDSKTGMGGRGKSKLLSSPRHAGSRRLHSESFKSGERLDTPRRRRAFMLFFFRAASAALVSGRQTGSSRMLVRRTLDATLLLRDTRERRWMYEDTASQVVRGARESR